MAAWPGLRAERLPPVPEDEVAALVQPICSRSAADLQPILEHLRDVVTGPEHLDFLLAWLAQQVQDPAQRERSHVEVAPFLPFQAVSGAPPAHGCLHMLPTSRERDW